MVRRGQARKHAQRRDDRARDQRVGGDQGDYKPPPRTDCDARHAEWPLTPDTVLRIEAWKWSNADGLVDYALQASAVDFEASGWAPVPLARVDICHGNAHLHVLYPDERDETIHIARLSSINDVQDAFHQSIAVLRETASRINSERSAK